VGKGLALSRRAIPEMDERQLYPHLGPESNGAGLFTFITELFGWSVPSDSQGTSIHFLMPQVGLHEVKGPIVSPDRYRFIAYRIQSAFVT
jgi:hypothetical protein